MTEVKNVQRRTVRILHIDDSQLDAELIGDLLRDASSEMDIVVQYVNGRDDYLAALRRRDFDIIFSDFRMPAFDGDQALQAAREICPDIPFIMVTGEMGEERAIGTLQRGATDYVIKDRLFRLIPALRRALAEAENNRKRREGEEQIALLSRAVEQSPASIVITDINGTIEYVNQKFVQVTGYSREEVIGQNPRILKSGERPKEEYAQMWKTILAGGEWRGEFHNRKKSGELYWEFASISAVKDREGTFRHFLAIKEDITARKNAEEEIRRLNAELEERVRGRTEELQRVNHELETFSYSVSHDLKAPLRVIIGFIEMLCRDESLVLNQKQREHLDLIQKSAEQMNQLITSLLVFSRASRQVPQLVSVDVQALVRSVIEQQQGASGSHAPFIDVQPLPPVTADPVLLGQVFTNLIENAYKFTRPVQGARIEVGGSVERDENLYFVRDNGVGFPSAKASRLFTVFQRLHGQGDFEGTGIGLANVRKIVERHGGRVWAEGEEGEGAGFYFTLPRRAAQGPDEVVP